jgi:hypothetical protein
LNKKIDVVKGFQTSVNIAFDLHNDDKIKTFIPTMSSIDIVEEVLHSINSPNANRARLLVGAYGRGKSHIILVLMSLLFKKDKALFGVLLNKMNEINPKLYEYTLEYLKNDKKLLPVIVSGNSASLTQSFINALQQTLKNENLDDIMPETNFIAAVNAIERWKKDYPETYKKFTKSLGEPVPEFIMALKEFDIDAYERFIELFPTLTSGSEFNPFVGFDVTDLYEKVVDKLRDKGYSGVYIIYDEFSKYLESSIANATVSDTKLLQDFAEKCERSGDKQIHLMLISHKDLSNYIDNNLPKEKVDGWRGVSGRFKHISLSNNFSQMYEIISAVMKKEPKFWEKFNKDNNARFNEIEKRFIDNGILERETAEVAVRGCYPLHPISTFVLPRLSEKVAQNERTLFTFLSAEHKHTLAAFLKTATDEFAMLTPDYIYDYFESLLRKEHYTSETHKLYKLTSKVLDKLDDTSLGAKIIKTIALIYLIEQFEKLPPVYNRIVDTFIDSVGDIKEIEETLEYLIDEECIVYLKRSNGYLKIKESSGVDIQSEIENVIEKTRSTLSVKAILNSSAFDSYMYPTAYNDEMDITRYFDFTFIDSTEFFSVDNWERKIESIQADGVVYAIIPQSNEEIRAIKKSVVSTQCKHDRIMFIVPKKYTDIERISFEYSAVKMLKSKVVDDDLLSDEYDIFIEDLEEVIGSFIFSYARPETGGAEYFHFGKKLNLKRKAQISAVLSDICYQTYPHTPVINNESINKDTLPTVAINSRSKLVAGLLKNELDINLGLSGTGQDVSFLRSTLIQTGVLKDEMTKPAITLVPANDKMKAVLAVINDFLGSANSHGRNFKELYETLTLPQNGYGIKKGVLPIYIAAVLHHHKKYIVIKNKTDEVRITSDLLNSINEAPATYIVYMESWNEEKTQYIDGMAALFASHVSEKEKDYNTFSFIVLAMSRWHMGLPKYAKELKEIYGGRSGETKIDKKTATHIKFLSSLKMPSINAREYLFEKLFEIYDYKCFTVNIVDNITHAKELFDGAKAELVKALISDVKMIFNANGKKGATLTSVIRDWYEGLKSTTANHLFANNEEKVLQLMASVNNDEKTFMERLAKTVTGLRLDDWDNNSIEDFLSYLEQLKKTVSEFDRKTGVKTSVKTELYKLSFVGKNGTEVVKTFEKTKYTEKAKLLLNAITIELEDMGQSITEQEKRQVLMELLEKMC